MNIAGQRQHRHHLRRHRNIKSYLAGRTIALAPQPYYHRTQHTIADVEYPWPANRIGVNSEHISMMQMIVDHRCQQIVSHPNSVDIPGKMQVKLLHRHDLAIAATGSATFDTKRRSHRRLADCHHRSMPARRQGLPQSDGRGGFAFTKGRRSNCRHHHIARSSRTVDSSGVNFGHITPIWFEILRLNPQCIGNRRNGT